jgi:hypothetical protein
MGRSSQLFHPISEVLSSPLATMSPIAMGRPIKIGSLKRKEMLTVGLRESTWRMPKRMRLTQA